jgi:phosphoserine phosphatase
MALPSGLAGFPPRGGSFADVSEALGARIEKLRRVDDVDDVDEKGILAVFWDLDGTILKGDITEGLAAQGDDLGYKGLADLVIEAGFLEGYSGLKGVAQFRHEYAHRSNVHELPSFAWLGQRFLQIQESRMAELQSFCRQWIGAVYKHYVFQFSWQMMQYLQEKQLRQFIISASPHIFLTELYTILPVNKEDIYGLYKPSEKLSFPLQYGVGKAARVRSLVETGAIVPAFACGNHWASDGSMMQICIDRGGACVFINGRDPVMCDDQTAVYRVDCSDVLGRARTT